VIDLGEAFCFACNYSKRWISGESRPDDLAGIWTNEGLERCHLAPRAKGGSDSVDNLVLLCRECHLAAPDCMNPDIMLSWIARRESWVTREIHRMSAAIDNAGLDCDEFAYWQDLIPDALAQIRQEAVNAPGDKKSTLFGLVAQLAADRVATASDPGDLGTARDKLLVRTRWVSGEDY
jgi:HNH endonuclease